MADDGPWCSGCSERKWPLSFCVLPSPAAAGLSVVFFFVWFVLCFSLVLCVLVGWLVGRFVLLCVWLVVCAVRRVGVGVGAGLCGAVGCVCVSLVVVGVVGGAKPFGVAGHWLCVLFWKRWFSFLVLLL